ncbi:uncharacterized protein LOC120329961 [Styela clava]
MSMSADSSNLINKDEILISLVKSHPMLFDHSHVGYRQKELRESIWQDIANTLQCRPKEATDRWRSLRDKYCRTWRRSLTNPGIEQDWYLFNAMNFIQPHLRPKLHHSASSGAVIQDTQEIAENDLKLPVPQIIRHRNGGFAMTTNGSVYLSDSSECSEGMPPLPKRPRKHVFQYKMTKNSNTENLACIPEILRLLEEKQSAPTSAASDSSTCPQDEDDLFMSSMTTALKRMEPKQKFEIKMGIMKLMYKTELEHDESPGTSNIVIPSK